MSRPPGGRQILGSTLSSRPTTPGEIWLLGNCERVSLSTCCSEPCGGGTLAVYTDSPEYTATLLPEETTSGFSPAAESDLARASFLRALLLPERGILRAPERYSAWPHLLLTDFAPRSNYDALLELARRDGAPDGLACLAGSGRGFHGFKGRTWAAEPGNLHLSVHWAPEAEVERFDVAFTVLAALSVAQAVDALPGMEGRAAIKWVNDLRVHGAKVGGVLAYTQTRGRVVTSAVLGMGVNVDRSPEVPATPFVPRTGCLRDYLADDQAEAQRPLLRALLVSLHRNYRTLLREGYRPLLEAYRERSEVLGRQVTVCSEDSDQDPRVLASGRVVAMGEGLELYTEGRSEPLPRGRLVFDHEQVAVTGGGIHRLADTIAQPAHGAPFRD